MPLYYKGEVLSDGEQGPAGSDATVVAGDGLSKTGDTLNVATPVRNIVTQEEFDALPEETKNNGFYIIDDGLGYEGVTYSTEEIRVGTWIDGKPLYRIVIPSTTPPSVSNQHKIAEVANDKETVFLDAIYTPSNTWAKTPGITVDGFLFLWYVNGAINCAVSNPKWVNVPIYIVLTYTKKDQSTISVFSEMEAGGGT